ncbi:MAG: type II toxin-antitoxin system VapC family toxin [Oscillospiraceae bacterium]|nr:type II toxin-antitoxin system VapC family toxin [Oscillospiraceae bacterium]
MKILVDTHILIWAAGNKLSPELLEYIIDDDNILLFSSASIWEITIKYRMRKEGFNYNPISLYSGLIDAGYIELPISAKHSLQTMLLPDIHKDPFDRIMVAQALSEGLSFLTSDKTISEYPGSIIYVAT